MSHPPCSTSADGRASTTGNRRPGGSVTGLVLTAGAVNGALVAPGSDVFPEATRRLARAWSGLQVSDVFRTDVWALGSMAFQRVRDLALGGLIGGGRIQIGYGDASARIDETEAFIRADEDRTVQLSVG
jgi:hypothetical protein